MAACRSFQRALELDHKNAQAQQEVGLICLYEKWRCGASGRNSGPKGRTDGPPSPAAHLADFRQMS